MNLRRDRNLLAEVGGNISSRSIQELYLGVQYNYLKRWLYSFNLNLYTGRFYRATQFKTRISIPARLAFYFEPEYTFNHWDYIKISEILLPAEPPTLIEQFDQKIGLNLAFSYGIRSKIIVSGARFDNRDLYSNATNFASDDKLDKTDFGGYTMGVMYCTNSLNRKQYASSGTLVDISFRYIIGTEQFEPGTTSIFTDKFTASRQWFRLKASREEYFGKSFYKWGYLLEGTVSNQPVFHNYRSSVLAAPGFYPLQDSKTLFLSNFRAFNYAAGGLRSIFSLRRNLDVRLEGYGFISFNQLYEATPQVALERRFQDMTPSLRLAATAGVVFHSPLGPLSLSANYYNDLNRQLGFLLHFGYLLYHPRALD